MSICVVNILANLRRLLIFNHLAQCKTLQLARCRQRHFLHKIHFFVQLFLMAKLSKTLIFLKTLQTLQISLGYSPLVLEPGPRRVPLPGVPGSPPTTHRCSGRECCNTKCRAIRNGSVTISSNRYYQANVNKRPSHCSPALFG